MLTAAERPDNNNNPGAWLPRPPEHWDATYWIWARGSFSVCAAHIPPSWQPLIFGRALSPAATTATSHRTGNPCITASLARPHGNITTRWAFLLIAHCRVRGNPSLNKRQFFCVLLVPPRRGPLLLTRREYGFLCGDALSGIITWADRRRAGNPPSQPTKTGSVVIKKYCERERRAPNEKKVI